MSTRTPIACTLTPSALADRVEWVRQVNKASLRAYRQQGSVLELTYAPQALTDVRDLVQREQECCAFLRFTVEEGPEAVRLRIEAPSEAGGAATLLLAPFLAGAMASCACCPQSRSDAEASREPGDGAGRLTGAAAVTSAGVAVVCGVCCVLPFAFPVVAVTALGSIIATLAGLFWWARILAVLLVGTGWLWLAWRTMRTRRWPAPTTLRAMAAATLFLGLALSWPFVERQIMQALGPRS